MYVYPYGDSQQLNLDWIINKLKELEDREISAADLEEIANVFIALTHSSETQYQKYDYCYYQGKLYRALNDNIGAFNASDWMEVTLGDDIPVLTRLVNADSALITTLQNQLTSLATTVNVQSLAELSAFSENHFIQIGAVNGITLDSTGITLPRYSKGVLVVSSSASCSLYVITPQGDLIYARKDSTWTYAETISSLDARITTNTTSISAIEKGIAIIVDGDTASYPISTGKFAYIKNNTHGLTEGLYTANSAFPITGGTADSTAFTPVNDGGLNTLDKKFYYGELVTPAEHYHYIDINRTVDGTTYNYIIVSLAQNADFMLCSYILNSSTFRVIARNPDGTSATSQVKFHYILCK